MLAKYRWTLFLFKGTLPRDFRPLFFFIKQLPLAPDTAIKTFLNMASNSRTKSTMKSPIFVTAGQWRIFSGMILNTSILYAGQCCQGAEISAAKHKSCRKVIDTGEICTAVSLTPLWHAQRCHAQHAIDTAVQPTLSIYSANTKQFSKWLQPVCQGPRGSNLMKKKNRGRKSHVRVTLNDFT
jgi:hypothetical protein